MKIAIKNIDIEIDLKSESGKISKEKIISILDSQIPKLHSLDYNHIFNRTAEIILDVIQRTNAS